MRIPNEQRSKKLDGSNVTWGMAIRSVLFSDWKSTVRAVAATPLGTSAAAVREGYFRVVMDIPKRTILFEVAVTRISPTLNQIPAHFFARVFRIDSFHGKKSEP